MTLPGDDVAVSGRRAPEVHDIIVVVELSRPAFAKRGAMQLLNDGTAAAGRSG